MSCSCESRGSFMGSTWWMLRFLMWHWREIFVSETFVFLFLLMIFLVLSLFVGKTMGIWESFWHHHQELRRSRAFSILSPHLGTGLKKFNFICLWNSINITYLVLGLCLWDDEGTFRENNWIGELEVPGLNFHFYLIQKMLLHLCE